MAVATIKLVAPEYFSEFYFSKNAADVAKKAIKEGKYLNYGSMSIQGKEGEAVAEEVFDLTNNPSREDERAELYGDARSVSVGDIINVDGVDYLCMPSGWKTL